VSTQSRRGHCGHPASSYRQQGNTCAWRSVSLILLAVLVYLAMMAPT